MSEKAERLRLNRLGRERLRAQRRKAGVCPECGAPLAEGKSRCYRHLRLAAEHMKRKRKIRLFQHVCTYCGGELDERSSRTCSKCLDRRRARRAA